MEKAPSRLTTKPTYLTTQLAVHAHRLAGEAFVAAGARGYHYRVLSALDEAGPSSQAALGRGVSMDRSDVANAVNELVELGQVERTPDPTDGRRNSIRLTAAGRRQLRRLDRALEGAQDRFVEPLSPDERLQLQDLLARLLDHHGSNVSA